MKWCCCFLIYYILIIPSMTLVTYITHDTCYIIQWVNSTMLISLEKHDWVEQCNQTLATDGQLWYKQSLAPLHYCHQSQPTSISCYHYLIYQNRSVKFYPNGFEGGLTFTITISIMILFPFVFKYIVLLQKCTNQTKPSHLITTKSFDSLSQ
jgi:hypothetical protein